MDKIKVLHFFGKMDMGGAETFVLNLYRHIDRNEVQFEFAVTNCEKGYYDEEIIKLGGEIHILPYPKADLKKYKESLGKLLKQGNYDVVHSHVHYFSGVNLSVAKRNGVNIRIAHSHTYNHNRRFSLKRTLYEKCMRYLIYKSSTHFLACSREAANELFVNRCKMVEIVNNGIDIDRFSKKKYAKEEYKKALNLPDDSFIIGHIGGFRPEKNHSKLVDIFLEVLKVKKNAHLVMVGDGEKKSEIEALVRNLGIKDRVHFLGIRKDTENILAAFDTFVFPSFYEGLGIAVIEAQVSGLYCIVSDTLPKAVDITSNVAFLSLDADQGVWRDAILFNNSKKKEISMVRDFDIKCVCKHMYSFYSG